MSENTSLVLLSRADLALEEADTIYKLKELRNLALTAADWLKRKNASESIIQKARTLALEAERKMGQMLIEASEKGEREIRGGDRKSKFPDGTLIKPTLADLRLSKKESARAQFIASISREKFDDIKEGKKTITAPDTSPACISITAIRNKLDVAAMIRQQVAKIPKAQLLPEEELCRLTAGLAAMITVFSMFAVSGIADERDDRLRRALLILSYAVGNGVGTAAAMMMK